MNQENYINSRLKSLNKKEILCIYNYAFQMRKALCKKGKVKKEISYYLQKVFNDTSFNFKKKSKKIKGKIVEGKICLLEKNSGLFLFKSKMIPFIIKSSLSLFHQSELSVGDHALFLFKDKVHYLQIPLKRNNALIRKHPHNKNTQKIIASNIDLIFVVCSVKNPKFNPYVIDRFLIAAQNAKAEVIIGINKKDLLENQKLINEYKKVYKKIGIKTILYSTKMQKDKGLEKIKKLLKNKTSLFIGHSGVGKSSTLNNIDKNLKITIKENRKCGRGQHTTNKTHLYQIENNTFIIDTPGMREFDYINIAENEVIYFFPEIFAFADQCAFANCTHTNEAHCKVQKALKEKAINKTRYLSYRKILEEIKKNSIL